MKVLFAFFLTVVCLNVFAQQLSNSQPKQPTELVRQELLHNIQRFTNSWAQSDTATLAKLLADEYRHTDIWGKILHKQDWLVYAATPRQISDIATDDVETFIYYEHLAVVTGKMSYAFGEQKLAQELRFTQVWSNSDGHWKRTTFQATLIDKTK